MINFEKSLAKVYVMLFNEFRKLNILSLKVLNTK